jgi:hypothetical protein
MTETYAVKVTSTFQEIYMTGYGTKEYARRYAHFLLVNGDTTNKNDIKSVLVVKVN